jgi:hypothetical protein
VQDLRCGLVATIIPMVKADRPAFLFSENIVLYEILPAGLLEGDMAGTPTS